MGLARTLIASATGLLCKAFLNLGGCSSVTVNGLPILLDALRSPERRDGRGIITVANHISTLDDPLIWGVLPTRCFFSQRNTRWALGAHDIMFTNPVFSGFFRAGQVLETFRGRGVHQAAVDDAIHLLDDGEWIHMYSEGKINTPDTYQVQDGLAKLIRFKWGVGRIAMEAAKPPLVIPMWITGFNNIMPEGRAFPYKYLPRTRQSLSITFGAPVPSAVLAAALDSTPPPLASGTTESVEKINAPSDARRDAFRPSPWLAPKALEGEVRGEVSVEEVQRIRSAVTAVIQREVEALGRRVSGDMLGKQAAP